MVIHAAVYAFFRRIRKIARKVTISFVMCVCLSIRPHGTAGLPPAGN